MIISEKQIMQLIMHLQDYIKTLGLMKEQNLLSESSKINIESSVRLFNSIIDQQSEELKVIDNYHDPNCVHKIDKEIKFCKLCGLPSHCIPCVGGWI